MLRSGYLNNLFDISLDIKINSLTLWALFCSFISLVLYTYINFYVWLCVSIYIYKQHFSLAIVIWNHPHEISKIINSSSEIMFSGFCHYSVLPWTQNTIPFLSLSLTNLPEIANTNGENFIYSVENISFEAGGKL